MIRCHTQTLTLVALTHPKLISSGNSNASFQDKWRQMWLNLKESIGCPFPQHGSDACMMEQPICPEKEMHLNFALMSKS